MSIIVLSSKIFFAVSQGDEDIIAVKISDILNLLRPQQPKLVPALASPYEAATAKLHTACRSVLA